MATPGLTLGFLVDTLAEDYQRTIFSGFNAEAARLNIGVCCFVAGPISISGATAQQNRLYDCISSARLGGLVLTSAAIGNRVGNDALSDFVRSFAPLPMCSVGVQLLACPSVTVDNQAGMAEALTHLIAEVGRRRIAFIRGPASNREAEERFQVYKDVLAEHRLSLEPDLVTSGDFGAASGAQAMRTLIDERRMGFDAVVAASDLMALGALNELLERGVAVPERVSVVGFDDIEAARFAASPLTTVRQPLLEIGRRALESVLNQLYGTEPVSDVVLPARLVKRQSTVLPLDTSPPPGRPNAGSAAGTPSIEQAYRNVRAELCADLRREAAWTGPELDWPEQLCNSFVSEATGRRSGLLTKSSLDYLEQLLLRVVNNHGDPNAFQRVVSRMRGHLRPLFESSPQVLARAEDTWHKARISIGSIAERHLVQQRLQLQHLRASVSEVCGTLLRASTWQELERALQTQLPRLGIPACALCTFLPEQMAQVRAAFDATGPATPSDAPFPARQLLPAGLLDGARRRTLHAETLYLDACALGYVVFEAGPAEPEVYEHLRDALTGAVRGLGAAGR